MASQNIDLLVKCYIISVPTEYLHSICDQIKLKLCKAVPNCHWGSNTVVVNDVTFVKLGLEERESSTSQWAVLRVGASDEAFTKRMLRVEVCSTLSDDTAIISEDLLFNLEQSCGQISYKITQREQPYLLLTRESNNNTLKPEKAIKLLISLFQCESDLDESFIDKLMVNYFSRVQYLCANDVFSVPLPEHLLELINNSNMDTVYFKVCKIDGPPKSTNQDSGLTQGFLVDSTVTIHLTTNHQGFMPSRRLPLFYKSLNSFLDDDKFVMSCIKDRYDLVPQSFEKIFQTLLEWIEPFLMTFTKVQEAELSPLFLMCGKNGSGKSLLLDTVSKYCGLAYLRHDCVGIGAAAPGQAEARLKHIFSQATTAAPCILHMANVEALCQDAELKDDVRVIDCFKHHVKQLKSKWPVIIIATSEHSKNISSLLNHLFLESTTLNPPIAEQRESILTWLVNSRGHSIDPQTIQTVAAHTSGFGFRDLQVLVSLAFKEKYKRKKDGESKAINLIWSDFSKIIDCMHKSYSDSIGAPKVPSVSWKDVGGLEHLKKEILRSLRSNMFNSGLKRSGLLLHGPPGTGKTLLAKAVATQCGRNFLSIKGPELLNMYVGQSEHNVRDLFELAKAASPCIVFFDELDSLAPNRGKSGDSGGVMDTVVSQLLAEMDDLGGSADVFVLGATNRPDLIDPALLRPGRLDKLLYVGPCEDQSSQLSVIAALTRKLSLGPDVDLPAVVSLLPERVSGAQLSALCSAAWMSSARQLIQAGVEENRLPASPTVVVTQQHFLSALAVIAGHL